VKLDLFKREELSEAYREVSPELQPANRIGGAERRAAAGLRDPLMLRLVAESHKNGSIESIRRGEIYPDYIHALEVTGRLQPGDVVLLQRDIVPLMISRGHYDNKATPEQIDRTLTGDHRSLRELIFNDDPLGDQSVNAHSVAW